MAAEAATAETEQGAAEEAAPKKGRGKLLLVVALVLLLAGGGGAAAWYLGYLPFGDAAAPEEAEPEAHETAQVGALHAFDPFLANLEDADGNRYLKAALQVEFFEATPPHDFEARVPQLRDLLLTLFTSKTYAEIRTPDGKALLRDDIINRINRTMGRDVVKAVYFTEFIVQ
jgi:flagellar FliL protein